MKRTVGGRPGGGPTAVQRRSRDGHSTRLELNTRSESLERNVRWFELISSQTSICSSVQVVYLGIALLTFTAILVDFDWDCSNTVRVQYCTVHAK